MGAIVAVIAAFGLATALIVLGIYHEATHAEDDETWPPHVPCGVMG